MLTCCTLDLGAPRTDVSSPRLLLKSKKLWTDACKAKTKEGWMKLGIITWLGLWACKMIGSKPCDVIGYPMVLSCLLGTTRCAPQEQFPRKPYTTSFIDQPCSVKMAGYWPPSCFACLWTRSTSSRSINTQNKELARYPLYPAILTSHLIKNPCTLGCFVHIIPAK